MKLEHIPTKAAFTKRNVREIDPNDPAQKELESSGRKYGFLNPLLVHPPVGGRYEVLDGNRRLLAAVVIGLETIPVIVTERLLSDTEIRLIQLTTSLQRKDLSGYEKFVACTDILCASPGMDQQKLAEQLGLSEASVTKLLSPSKLSAEWQDALKAAKVTISDCYQAARVPASQHAGLLALKLSGGSGEQMAKAARKPRTTLTIKLSRVKMPLQDGATVVVSGAGEMDMDDLIETLGSALDAAKKANKESLDVSTAQRVWSDKARKA